MTLEPLSTAKTVSAAVESASKLQKLWRWWRNRRYPKPPINHFGIVLGITTENDAQRAQLRSDFVTTLKNQLKEYPNLTVLELSENLAAKIDTEQDALFVLKKTESVFLLWGGLRRRHVNSNDTFVMDLQSAVRHSPIARSVQTVFAQEISEVLPIRRFIPATNDLIGFETSALTIDLAVRYVIATAAYLSNQRPLAKELWEKLRNHLATIETKTLSPSLDQLLKRLSARVTINLVTFHLDEASIAQYKWRVSRNTTFLERMLEDLDAAESYKPNLFSAALLRALYSFVMNRDVKASRKILMQFQSIGVTDATWAFDMAFFYAYEGKLTQATGFYKKAFALNTDAPLLVEIEEWLLWIMSEEPSRVQLHYCVGLLNYFGKKDFIKAKQDFEIFLDLTEGQYPKERKAIKKYLDDIENQRAEQLLWQE